MGNIFRIFKSDLKGLSRNFFALVVAIGLCLLPALYAWFNIYSNWDPYGNTGNIKIAVANLDEGWVNEAGETLNMGDNIEDGLREKTSIGWVFVDEELEAVDGVRSGEYYAAIVIESDFTYSMYHGVAANIENPKITYYVNGKKNAVATKITDTAVSTLQTSINEEFIAAVTEQIFTKTNSISEDLSNQNVVEDFITKLKDTSEDLQECEAMMDRFMTGNELLGDTSASAGEDLKTGQDSLNRGISDLEQGQQNLDSTERSFAEFSSQVHDSLNQVQNSLTKISADIEKAQLDKDAATLATDANQVMADAGQLSADLQELYDSLQQAQPKETTEVTNQEVTEEGQKLAILTVIKDAQLSTDELAGSGLLPTDGKLTKATMESVQEALSSYGDTVERIQLMYDNQIVPQVNELLNQMSDVLVSVENLLTNISQTAGTLSEVFLGVDDTLDMLNMSLAELKVIIGSANDKLSVILGKLEDAQEEEQMEMILNLLAGDPETLSSFFAEPVKVEANYIYEISNYGSGVSPFYTTLAIWVGMTILVSLVKVHANTEGLEHVKNYQLFFGRYLIFFVLSQIQALVIVLGDLYWLKIQCLHPFEFWLAAAAASMTFSLMIYALTIAFGDIGKAFAVVIMVIQIAGSGGTYPIEALPSFFRAVYIFFPFPYAIDAMRECIGGMYENTYLVCLGKLGLFCAAALIVGLVIRIPFIKVNHFIEKRMEDTRML